MTPNPNQMGRWQHAQQGQVAGGELIENPGGGKESGWRELAKFYTNFFISQY